MKKTIISASMNLSLTNPKKRRKRVRRKKNLSKRKRNLARRNRSGRGRIERRRSLKRWSLRMIRLIKRCSRSWMIWSSRTPYSKIRRDL